MLPTHRNPHPVDCFQMVEALNGKVDAKTGCVHDESSIYLSDNRHNYNIKLFFKVAEMPCASIYISVFI